MYSPRDHVLLSFAQKLIRATPPPPERAIAEAFIFGFESSWCRRLSQVRLLIARLVGREGDALLPEDLATRMWVHLYSNRGLAVTLTLRDRSSTSVSFKTAEGTYHPYDESLVPDTSSLLDPDALADPPVRGQLAAFIGEARLTQNILDRVNHMARVYQIVPLGEDQWRLFSLEKIEDQLVNLRNFILFGHPTPTLVWPEIAFIESKMPHKVFRWLRPDSATAASLERRSAGTPGLRRDTRIRTWTVYFLTKRGGGSLSERAAVDTWNAYFGDQLEQRNFRAERDRLLKLGSRLG